jgi:hypothetical protein
VCGWASTAAALVPFWDNGIANFATGFGMFRKAHMRRDFKTLKGMAGIGALEPTPLWSKM